MRQLSTSSTLNSYFMLILPLSMTIDPEEVWQYDSYFKQF